MSYSSGAYQTSEQRRYLDGQCHETTGGSPAQTYWHGDLIASTFATSDSAGDLADAMAYTAFGERINLGDGAPPGSFPRYQYAGGFGYESGLISLSGANTDLPTMSLQHLGQRWYDPALGRFVQRDPLGIVEARNPYVYILAQPNESVDPTGLTSYYMPWSWPNFWVSVAGGAGAGAAGGALTPPPLTWAGVGAGAAGGAVKGAGGYLLVWTALCIIDIGATLGDLSDSEDNNSRQRRQNPGVFGPMPKSMWPETDPPPNCRDNPKRPIW